MFAGMFWKSNSGQGDLPGFKVKAGEMVTIMVEMDYTHKFAAKDFSLVVVGSKGKTTITHDAGLTSDESSMPFLAK